MNENWRTDPQWDPEGGIVAGEDFQIRQTIPISDLKPEKEEWHFIVVDWLNRQWAATKFACREMAISEMLEAPVLYPRFQYLFRFFDFKNDEAQQVEQQEIDFSGQVIRSRMLVKPVGSFLEMLKR